MNPEHAINIRAPIGYRMKRGFTYEQAIAYVGVKRRTFDDIWRPRLVCMPQGSCLIFDLEDLDRVFDELKAESQQKHTAHPSAATTHAQAPNARQLKQHGTEAWEERRPVSIRAKTEAGRSTAGMPRLDFASAASQVLKRQRAG